MDRTGKLILFGSVALLIASFIFQSRKASQRSVQRRDDANSTKQGTSPPPVISSPTNAPTTQTPSTNAVPGSPSAPEKTVVLQNDFVRYTFTTHGGGIKRQTETPAQH